MKKFKFILFISLLFVICILDPAFSMPPHPKNNLLTKNTKTKNAYISAKQKGLNKPAKYLVGSTGIVKALVIIVDFSNKVGAQTKTHYTDLLFSSASYPTGSMRDYYQEVSYNNLDVQGTVYAQGGVNWYRMPQTYTYYVNGQSGLGNYPQNAQKLVEDAVLSADADINFSQYDNDSDGFVDALFIVHAGIGAESQSGTVNDIWSHKWNTNSPITVDGVKVYEYTIEPEDATIGVFCHEFGHILGLPDLYDTDNSSYGVGDWSVMGSGTWGGPSNDGTKPVHFDLWSKKKLGWINATVINSNQTALTILPVETNAVGYKLWTDGTGTTEYFLAENRQKTGFDTYLPASGLVIYHIDENVADNTNETHYKVAVEQADGLKNLENKINTGDANDVFPGGLNKISFSYNTTPDSKSYSNTVTKVSVKNISTSGNNIIADLFVSSENTLTVTSTSIAGANILQGSASGFLKLILSAANNTVSISSLKIDLLGSAQDSDTDKVFAYLDNGDGNLSTSTDTLLTQSTFVSKQATLNFNLDVTTASTKVLYLVLQTNTNSQTSKNIGLSINSNSYFTVDALSGVATSGFPHQSTTAIIQDGFAPTSSVSALSQYKNSLSFTVSWNGQDNIGGSGIASYDIQYKDGDSGSWTDWLTNTTSTQSMFTAVETHTYYFRSKAKDGAGLIEDYPTIADTQTTIDTTAPISTFTALATETNTANFSINWSGTDNLSGIKNYDIQYKDGSGGTWTNLLSATTSTSTTFSGSDNHTYYFRVKAQDNAGNNETVHSSSGDTFTNVYIPPSTPTNLILNLSTNNSVSMQWTANSESDLSGYKIYKSSEYTTSEPTDATFTLLNQATANSYIDSSVSWDSTNKKYWYKISAIDSSNKESAKTSSVSIQDTNVPQISVSTSSITDTQVILNITSNENITLKIDYGLDTNYGNTLQDNTGSTSHSITLTNLNPQTTYHYKITAFDGSQNQTASSDATFTTLGTNYLPVMSNVSASANTISATISWTTDIDADSKVVYGTTTSYGSEVYSATKTISHSIDLTNLQKGTTYYFKVYSRSDVNNAGTEAISSEQSFTTAVVDTTAPEVIYVPSSYLPIKNNCCFEVAVSDNVGIKETNIFIKKKNDPEYTKFSLYKTGNVSDTNFEIYSFNLPNDGLPPEFFSSQGINFYINTIDTSGNEISTQIFSTHFFDYAIFPDAVQPKNLIINIIRYDFTDLPPEVTIKQDQNTTLLSKPISQSINFTYIIYSTIYQTRDSSDIGSINIYGYNVYSFTSSKIKPQQTKQFTDGNLSINYTNTSPTETTFLVLPIENFSQTTNSKFKIQNSKFFTSPQSELIAKSKQYYIGSEEIDGKININFKCNCTQDEFKNTGLYFLSSGKWELVSSEKNYPYLTYNGKSGFYGVYQDNTPFKPQSTNIFSDYTFENIKVIPNPVTNNSGITTANIHFKSNSNVLPNIQVNLFNTQGKIIYIWDTATTTNKLKNLGEGNFSLPLDLPYNLPNGIYFVGINFQTNNSTYKKIIKIVVMK